MCASQQSLCGMPSHCWETWVCPFLTSWLVKVWAASDCFEKHASSQGLALANSILQELSWVRDKSSSCSPWNGCGQGETHSCVPPQQHPARGMGWTQRWGCHVLRACKAYGVTETDGGGKRSWIPTVWRGFGGTEIQDSQQLRWELHWVFIPSQLSAVTTGLVSAQPQGWDLFVFVAAPKGSSGIILRALTTPVKKTKYNS